MELFKHQQEALEQTKDLNRVAYYLDVGLGKTFVGAEKSVSFDEPVILVVCQKSKVQDWIDHFRINYLWIDDVLDLTNKKMMELFIGMVKATNGCTLCPPKYKRVAVINYELAFRRPDLLKLKNFTVVIPLDFRFVSIERNQNKTSPKVKNDIRKSIHSDNGNM